MLNCTLNIYSESEMFVLFEFPNLSGFPEQTSDLEPCVYGNTLTLQRPFSVCRISVMLLFVFFEVKVKFKKSFLIF